MLFTDSQVYLFIPVQVHETVNDHSLFWHNAEG